MNLPQGKRDNMAKKRERGTKVRRARAGGGRCGKVTVTNRREGTQRLINSNSAGHRGGVISLQSLHSISSFFFSLPIHSHLPLLHSFPFLLASFLFFLFSFYKLFIPLRLQLLLISPSFGHFHLTLSCSHHSILVLGIATSTMNLWPGLFNSQLHHSPLSSLNLYKLYSYCNYANLPNKGFQKLLFYTDLLFCYSQEFWLLLFPSWRMTSWNYRMQMDL